MENIGRESSEKEIEKESIEEMDNMDDNEDDDIDDDDDDDDEDGDESPSHNINRRLQKASLTESYSEILNSPTGSDVLDAKGSPIKIPQRRPTTLGTAGASSFPRGSVSVDDGNMTHFVADNLEYKIKIASPATRKELEETMRIRVNEMSSEASSAVLQRQFLSSMPQVDPNVLSDIEIEAQYLAANVDNITENLCNLLHSISSIAADNVETYKNAVNKLTDCMDSNIKTMYTIIAKAEEISKTLKSTENLAVKIREIKRLVDVLDSIV